MATRRSTLAVIGVLTVLASLLPAAPAFAADDARVQGVVTMPDGGVPDAPVRVVLSTTDGENPVTTEAVFVDASGFYAFDAPAGAYYLWFEYHGEANVLPWIRSNGSWPTGLFPNPEITLTSGSPLTVNRPLVAGAVISGTATGAGGVPLESLAVSAENFFDYGRSSFDPATGIYTLDRVPRGTYEIDFTSPPRWRAGSIPAVTLAEGQSVSGVDIELTQTTTIEGRLSYRGAPLGQHPEGIRVSLWKINQGGSIQQSVVTGADGSYHFYDATPGTYAICVFYNPHAFENCWNDVPYNENPPTVTVTAGQILSGYDFPVEAAGSVEGRILSRTSSTPAPLASGRVMLYRLDDGVYMKEWDEAVQLDGTFLAGPLAPGQYRVRFSDDDGVFDTEYWDDQRYFAWGIDVEVEAGSTLTLDDAVLESRTIDVARLQGTDRFDVGVAISRDLFPTVPSGGVPVVYVANGYNFPDALVAGPAAARHGGGVLLVEPTAIPPAVAAELMRLNPQRIVVAGGPASVSPAVYSQLRTYVDSSSDIFRANGIDRYEASRALIRDAFEEDGATKAIITTGGNFPDALSAGPAAASQNGPVILVDGTASRLDAATRDLLVDLGVEFVYIAGGTGSVSPGIETSLRNLLGSSNVHRFAGVDRFEVGVLVSQEFFASDTDHAFVATAFKFPDALTGGPLAAAYGGPLYLSPPECLPRSVAVDILDLGAQKITLLGGPASLTSAVERLQLC